ncbi:MAG: FemAB family PEP-CTERM system-associated protein [Gammaproteobacteria bacterium]|nr:FemAB family PEP-CTERM system-associated protein [Gammaproteobacteria bacterium]
MAELMSAMQRQSAEGKRLEAELNDVDIQILDFFVSSNAKQEHETRTSTASSCQRYSAVATNTDNITVALLDREEQEWNDYVEKHPAATIHHLTPWRQILQKTYGIESFYFVARNDGHRIVGVLPLVRLKSRLFGDMLVSMPYFQRGGAIADHPAIETTLMQSANREAARLGIDHIEYRDDIPRQDLLALTFKVNMILALPDSEETLWHGFTAKLRAQIKRPQQLAPRILIGGKEYLDDFYKVYSRNMRDLGSPVHSRLLLENMLKAFPGKSWIIVIRLNNIPVSAGFLLGHGDTMEVPLASTIREANPHSMNMLLYWEVLKLAVRQGYKNFDFGRSSKHAGTYRFKQQWGAQPKQLYWHYWQGEKEELPSLNPSNPKYALMIYMWKRLPVRLTQWLGPLIVKNIP